jgi:hypothetical protein
MMSIIRNIMSTALICILAAGVLVAQEVGPSISSENGTTAASPEKPAAQEATPASDAENAEKLRKAAQNPIASLISVPVQENWNFSVGPSDRTQNILNVQPVIPVSLGQNWNLVIRWITPVIYQPVDLPQTASPPIQTGYYGFGDMQPAFFISPKKSKVIWGVGPQLLLPTATNTNFLGQGKFGIGPTALALIQPGKWTVGVLANNVWSVAGHPGLIDVNQFLLQYFINYNLQRGWYLTWQPTLTANWKATNGGRWVVPVGGGVGRIMKLGAQPVNLTLQFYGNTVHPPGGSPWGMRMQIAFLFPKMPKKN